MTVEPQQIRPDQWYTPADHEVNAHSAPAGFVLRGLRRSKLDVCFDVLNSIWEVQEVKPTRLMQRANLSWRVLKDILGYLDEKGLVMANQVGSRQTFTLTELGTSCLEHLHAARRFFQTEGGFEDSLDSSLPKRTFPGESSPAQASTRGKSAW